MSTQTPDMLKRESLMAEFLEINGWKEAPDVDRTEQSISCSFGIRIAEQTRSLFIEAPDRTELVDVFIYYDFRCMESKIAEMASLINAIHAQWSYGRFEVLGNGRLRWCHFVDFSGSEPTGTSVDRIVQPGWQAVIRYLDPISAVALTKQSADDAMKEFDQEKAIANAIRH